MAPVLDRGDVFRQVHPARRVEISRVIFPASGAWQLTIVGRKALNRSARHIDIHDPARVPIELLPG
jgi:hypothetical protein